MSSKALRDRQQKLLSKRNRLELEELAVGAKQQHLLFRKLHDLEMRRRRASQTLGARLDVALIKAQQLSDVSAATVGHETAKLQQDSSPPPRINGALYTSANHSLQDTYSRRLQLLIEALEREVDSIQLRPLLGEYTNETADEAESRLIKEYEGIPASEIVFLDPSWARVRNPIRAIEKVRIKFKCNPFDGRKNA